MTVTYSAKVATANFSCFFKLLIRWRGSIYKILWKEFAIFSAAYFALSFIYRLVLTDTQKRYFEKGAEYCAQFSNLIPVAFVLGFYVNHIANRWWEKFRTLPWPGRTAMFVTAHLFGHNERARLMRRTIMRYMCLSYVITMSSISPPVKKRFPKWRHMTEAGFLLPNEEQIMENLNTPYNKFFVPLIWASALVTRARKEGMIKDDFAVKTLVDEINDFRTRSFQLFNFDWVNIPLVYTQVVTLAVYTFFLSCLMGRQYLDNGHLGDMYFPLFTFLQFFFYMGWLKVAETMLNPFGEDDDDFDINYLIDRHLKISYLVVDEMHAEHPELIRDQYWDTVDFDLPYTEETQQYKQEPRRGSAIDLDVHHHHHHQQQQQQQSHRLRGGQSSIISIPEEGIPSSFVVSNPMSDRRLPTRNNPIPSLQSNQSASSYGNSVFQVRRFGAKDANRQLLPRVTSGSSFSSQTSDGSSIGLFKSLKKTIANRTRRKSINTTDDRDLKLRSKPFGLTPSIPGSFQSTDLPYLGLDVDHDNQNAETIFQMSESDSDESSGSRTKKRRHRHRRRSQEEDIHGPIVFRAHRYNHHHHHPQYDHHDNRRGHDTGHQGASEHGVKRGHAAKDGGRHKDDDVLFPINELPDDTSGATGMSETEMGRKAGFTSGVTEVDGGPEVEPSGRRMSSRSAEVE